MRPPFLPPTPGNDQDVPIDDDLTPDQTARQIERAQDADLVARVRSRDPVAFGLLYDIWFDRVFNVALRIVRDRDIAAEVTQDAFLSAWRGIHGLEDAASFGGWLLRIGRNAALNRAEREARTTAVDQDRFAMIEQTGGSPSSAPHGFDVGAHLARFDDPATAAGDAQIVAMVREAAAALGARDAEVLDLQLRYQLTPAEVGQVLDLNRNAANQLCHRVRSRFAGSFGARLVWGDGRPHCAVLQIELTAAGIEHFGADAMSLITRHADDCLTCSEDRRSRLSPTALFASIPLVPVLLSVKSSVAHGLATSGVPMHGSVATASLPGGGSGTHPPSGTPTMTSPGTSPRTSGEGTASLRGTSRYSRRATVSIVGAAAAIVVLVAFLVFGNDGRSSPRLIAKSGSTSTNGQGRVTPTVTPTTTPSNSPATGRPGITAPLVSTGPTTPTSPPTTVGAPTTTIAPPSVGRFEITPATPQPAVYSMAQGPVLSWAVRNATDVTIWLWFDDGTHGDQRVGIEATGTSGSKPLCPGSQPTPQACSAASGHYRYELVATGADGSTFTDPTSPGFDVLPPVIN